MVQNQMIYQLLTMVILYIVLIEVVLSECRYWDQLIIDPSLEQPNHLSFEPTLHKMINIYFNKTSANQSKLQQPSNTNQFLFHQPTNNILESIMDFPQIYSNLHTLDQQCIDHRLTGGCKQSRTVQIKDRLLVVDGLLYEEQEVDINIENKKDNNILDIQSEYNYVEILGEVRMRLKKGSNRKTIRFILYSL